MSIYISDLPIVFILLMLHKEDVLFIEHNVLFSTVLAAADAGLPVPAITFHPTWLLFNQIIRNEFQDQICLSTNQILSY